MPTPLFAWACCTTGAEHAHAPDGVGMPPVRARPHTLADVRPAAYDTGMSRRQIAILAAVFVIGAYALCAQALLLRETQVILFGSELSWGLVLAFWLAGVAMGAAPLRRRETKPRWNLWQLVLVGNMISAGLLIEVMAIRFARLLIGVGPGEYVGPGAMVLLASTVFFVGLPVGVAFPAATALFAEAEPSTSGKARGVGGVFLVESAGSLVGGLLFSFFLVDGFGVMAIIMGGGIVVGLVIAAMVYFHERRRWLNAIPVAWATLLAVYLGTGMAGQADRTMTLVRWMSFAPPGMELVQSEDSRYQNLALGKLGDQYSLYTNGLLAATWPNDADFAIEAHLAACECPAPLPASAGLRHGGSSTRRILVLGGGVEGMLKELERYQPVRLDYVTLDPKLLELVRPHLAAPDRQALDRLGEHVHFADARRFAMQAAASRAEPYDLIVLAAPEPASTLEARLYTEDFFAQLAKVLSDRGVLALALHGSEGYWSEAQAEYVGSIVLALERVFPDVLLTFGYPTRCYAARHQGVLATTGEELARRYRAAGVESPYFDALWFAGASDLLDPAKRADLRRALDAHPPAFLNTDEQPIAALYHMRFWLQTSETAHAGATAEAHQRTDVLGWLMRLRFDWAVLVAVAATALAALVGVARNFRPLWHSRPRLCTALPTRGRVGHIVAQPPPAVHCLARTAVYWSIGTTGFATLALEIVLLYTFQTLYGYVYSMVGLVIGVFMAGLVLGSLAMNRAIRRAAGRPGAAPPGLRTVFALDMAMVVFAAALVIVLALLRGAAADWTVQIAMFALVAVAGLLGGLVFPLAASVVLEREAGIARAGGGLYAADNIGACLGAILTGVLLVPILGVTGACLVIAAVKALSAVFVGAAAATSPRRAGASARPSA